MTQKYHPIQIALHWLIVALVLVQYATSGAIVRTHEAVAAGGKPTSDDLFLHVVHNRGGLIIVALMVARLVARLWVGRRLSTDEIPTTSRAVAIGHAALYVLLIAQGLTGAIASYLWWPISIVHVFLFNAILVAVAGHIAMAIWHEFVRKDGTLRRMLPFAAEGRWFAGVISRTSRQRPAAPE
jgi:cytochrome b561